MHAESPPSPRLECPRCGYTVAATAQAADAGGEPRVVCSECGFASNPDELACGAVLAVAAFPVVACALLALLPGALRRAKVRRSHLLRGCVYACSFAPIALALHAAAQGIAVAAPTYLPGMHNLLQTLAGALMVAIPVGAIAFSAIHLDAFCTRYLILPRGRVVAIALNLTVLLAAIVVGLTVSNA